MTHEMCNNTVNKCLSVFNYIHDQYQYQGMCDRVISEDPFFHDILSVKYIIQKMCNKAVEDSLTTLKDIPDWCVTSMIKSMICYKID